ncbi:MAG: hypothetical protein OXQ90_16300 [Gammaproteobacteria bacterium]|nr:hypothetical protein [Gammaproteobacteria bacterium]
MSISGFFEHELNAPLNNVRWSWGAVDGEGNVYLRVWENEFRCIDGKRHALILRRPGGGDAHRRRPGRREREDHVERIVHGAKAFCVVCRAKDPEATPKAIASFDKTPPLQGRRVVPQDGNLYLEIGRP